MPRIDLIENVEYQPDQPYHHYYDNLPLKNINAKITLVNAAVDNHEEILVSAIGTQGTLANRLNQSMNSDGSLKADAIDEALHNIAEHEDGDKEISIEALNSLIALGYDLENPVDFVRMLSAERAKLALISDEATAFALEVEQPSTTVLFEDETVSLQSSETITWDVEAPNILKARTVFPLEAIHQHVYDVTPVRLNGGSDWKNWKTTSIATPFVEESLRVYINGFKVPRATSLSGNAGSVYVPPWGGGEVDEWNYYKFTEDYANGTFELNQNITSSDIIRIDFDVLYE